MNLLKFSLNTFAIEFGKVLANRLYCHLLKKPIASMVFMKLLYPSFSKYKLHFLQHPGSVYLVECKTHYTMTGYIVWSNPGQGSK